MAGRFAVQKLAASMSSRSRTLLRAHGGASSASAGGGGAPSARRTLSHLLHGPSATQPAGSSSAPNKLGLHIHGGRGAYDSARGPNRASSSSSVSSSTSTAGQEIGAGGTVEAWRAEWQAEWDAQDARIAASAADFDKFMSNLRLLGGFACASFAVGLFAEELTLRVRKNKGRSVPPSGCCSGCSRPLPAAAAAGDMAAHKAKAV